MNNQPKSSHHSDRLSDAERHDLELAAHRSRREIPRSFGVLCFLVAALWLANLMIRVPVWLQILMIGIPSATLAVDVINVLYVKRRLRPDNGL
ncbi:MAG TPA: hypothetical protein PLF11_14765 [Bacillota bacterium]|jgi:hypothetical protein|nr:hypothetical protein [Bacillota bacterium]